MEVLLLKTRLSIVACRYMVPFYFRGEPVKIPDIAEVYGFKPRSIHPAFSILTKAGILESHVGGSVEDRGFIFARNPKEITLYDIVKAIEGDEPHHSCSDLMKCQVADCKECSIYKQMQKVIDNRREILSATTIFEQYHQTMN